MVVTVGEHSTRVACQVLEGSQGFSTIFEKLLAVDIDSASQSERSDLGSRATPR